MQKLDRPLSPSRSRENRAGQENPFFNHLQRLPCMQAANDKHTCFDERNYCQYKLKSLDSLCYLNHSHYEDSGRYRDCLLLSVRLQGAPVTGHAAERRPQSATPGHMIVLSGQRSAPSSGAGFAFAESFRTRCTDGYLYHMSCFLWWVRMARRASFLFALGHTTRGRN
jgi:hypothetical protein